MNVSLTLSKLSNGFQSRRSAVVSYLLRKLIKENFAWLLTQRTLHSSESKLHQTVVARTSRKG